MNIQLGEKWPEMIEYWNAQIVIYYESDYTYRVHPETICCFTKRIRYAAAMLLLDLLQPPYDPDSVELGTLFYAVRASHLPT